MTIRIESLYFQEVSRELPQPNMTKRGRGAPPGPQKKNRMLTTDVHGTECGSHANVTRSKNTPVDAMHSTSISTVLSAACNWTCLIKFEERDPEELETTNTTDISVNDVGRNTTVDLVEKLRNTSYQNDKIYVFPKRFLGLRLKENLLLELKVACILGGFQIGVRSSRGTTGKAKLKDSSNICKEI